MITFFIDTAARWRTFGIPAVMLVIGVFIGFIVTVLGWVVYRRRQRQLAHAFSSSIELSEISEISKL